MNKLMTSALIRELERLALLSQYNHPFAAGIFASLAMLLVNEEHSFIKELCTVSILLAEHSENRGYKRESPPVGQNPLKARNN